MDSGPGRKLKVLRHPEHDRLFHHLPAIEVSRQGQVPLQVVDRSVPRVRKNRFDRFVEGRRGEQVRGGAAIYVSMLPLPLDCPALPTERFMGIRAQAAKSAARQRKMILVNQEAACLLRSEPSATARGRTRGAAFAAGRGERRENLLGLVPSALGALWRFRAAAQDELLEDVAASGAGVFKQGHGKATHFR
jgi:hypothetical protein